MLRNKELRKERKGYITPDKIHITQSSSTKKDRTVIYGYEKDAQ